MANLTGVIKTQKPSSVGVTTPSVGLKLPAITQPKYEVADITKGREEKFTEWENKRNAAQDQIQVIRKQIEAVKVKNAASQPATFKWYNLIPVVNIVTPYLDVANKQKENIQEARIKIEELTVQQAMQFMYASLYSVIPGMIQRGVVDSVDEAMSRLTIPSIASDSDLEDIKSTLTDMFSTLTQSEMAEEVKQQDITESDLFPKPVQPEKSEPMFTDSVQDLTVAELARTFQPIPIESAMSDSQWKQVLSGEGYSEADLESISIIDKEIEEAAANMAEYKTQFAAFEANAGKMDDYSIWETIKLAIETPGLALLDLANYYFEHVTMPTAGTVWRELAEIGAHAPVVGTALDHINDDMEKAYSESRAAGKSPWESAKLSWEDWDCNWFLKYVVMEGLVDPTTYLGTGIASRIIKPTTRVGRMVEVVDKGFREVSEIPFDAFKSWMNSMPKTASQRATMRQITGSSTVKSAITASANRSIRQIPISELSDKMVQWVDLAMAKPHLETKPVLAAKELLYHAPLGEKDLSRWSERLGHSLSPEDVSVQMLESADNLFENVFIGKLTEEAAAPELIRILTHGAATPDNIKIASKLISTRKSAIVTNAKSFSKYPSTYKAMRAIQERIYKTHMAVEESTLYSIKHREGRILTTLQHIEPEVLAAWRQTIDKAITKPFAEAYLCFSAYGFMNIIEDSMRSALDGVYPRRMDNELSGILKIGLMSDPSLENLSLSDMLGVIKKEMPEHYHQNWILRLSALGSEKWSSRFYEAMVHAPGMISADLKRNFEAHKMIRFLMEDSDVFRQMMKDIPAIPDTLSKDKKYRQELGKLMYCLVASANPHALDVVTDMMYSKTIKISKVKDVFAKYPELSKSALNTVLDSIESGEIFQDISKAAKTGADATAQAVEHQDSITKVMLKSESALIDDLLTHPDAAIGQFDGLYKHLVEAEMSNPEEMANLLLNLRIMSDLYGKTPQQLLAAASLQSRGMKFGDRSAVMSQALENTQKLVDRAGISLDNVVSDFKNKIDKLKLPADREIASREYLDTIQRQYLSTQIYADRIAEFRRMTFGSAKPSDLKSSIWWEDSFYGPYDSLMAEMRQVSANCMVDSHNAAKRAEAVFGAVETPRPPVVVSDREISAADVSKLVQARPSDMTSAIMGTMSVMGDRETYVAYVMSHVKTGDVGFTPESVGKVFDSLVYQTGNDPATLSWLTKQRHDLRRAEQDIRDMVFKDSVVKGNTDELTKYVESVKQYMSDRMYDNFPAKKIMRTKVIDMESGYPAIMKQNNDGTWSKISRDELLGYKGAKSGVVGTGTTDEGLGLFHRVGSPEEVEALKNKLAEKTKEYSNLSIAINAIGMNVPPDSNIIIDYNLMEKLIHKIDTLHVERDEGLILKVHDWITNSNNESLQQIGKIASESPDYMRKIHKVLKERYKSDYIRIYRGQGKANAKALDREFTNVTSNKNVAKRFEDHWIGAVGNIKDLNPSIDSVLIKVDDIVSIGSVNESELIIPSGILKDRIANPLIPTKLEQSVYNRLDIRKPFRIGKDTIEGETITFTSTKEQIVKLRKEGYDGIQKQKKWLPLVSDRQVKKSTWTGISNIPAKSKLKPEFANIHKQRQDALDKATKWLHKTYPDYTNANAMDAFMKQIYPFWHYESQRWFYIPRTFLTKPGTFTAYNRWQDNTDSGYVGVPGTPFEANPFRGTVFGTLSVGLMKQDMSDFSDAPYPLKGLLEYNDFLSRRGFYPGAQFGIPMTLISGGESKLGEAIPAVWSTPLNLLKAALPNNKLVNALSDRIFPNRFEEYLTAVEATKLGGDGKLIYAKIRENKELTSEEKAIWSEAKRTASLYSALFENASLLRLREPEQKRIREIASQLITEWFGISEYQQDWNYRHGVDTWEQIGGLSLSQQQILKELDYYRWTGLSRPIMSSDKQEIYNQLEIAWSDVEKHADDQRAQKADLEKKFLSGINGVRIGPSDYINGIGELQAKQAEYINQKQIEFPAMTLEGRAKMYKDFGMTMPVQHPLVELKNLYFSIELKKKTDPITGEESDDWDTFWAERKMVEDAIPDEYKQEWNTFLEKNMTVTEKLRRQANTEYFSKYNDIYDAVKAMHSEEEQSLISEYYSLKSLGSNLARQEEILSVKSSTFPGKSLISGFSTEVSHSREAFRAANPSLDAWLYYWGKVTSFKTDQARNIYNTLLSATGRRG